MLMFEWAKSLVTRFSYEDQYSPVTKIQTRCYRKCSLTVLVVSNLINYLMGEQRLSQLVGPVSQQVGAVESQDALSLGFG